MKKIIIILVICFYIVGFLLLEDKNIRAQTEKNNKSSVAMGVCPPFKLKDEKGNIIDPVHGLNSNIPYSPKQTCGTGNCHNYDLITEGFHFTQGKGEKMPEEFKKRYNWVLHPGNYGGNWCSPAPLYRQLAPKENTNPRTIDMTSFDFVTATCGNCHPGGGPLEYDRKGNRYDHYMVENKLKSGGENNLDGDYYKARWMETGVIEADCLLCHMPEYDLNKRNNQLACLNFKWAATEGAGFGNVSGKILDGGRPEVTYDIKNFDEEGNVILHIVPEPHNETCLNCHSKSDWKKRGASFSPRTDVHMAAGMKCIDCHVSGNHAVDERVKGKEVHQTGKGDCPSGWVRNDLDNTVRSCENCHLEGWHNAPRAEHNWLPPLHLDKISCQACHIPSRPVKSALIQASDVYNPAPRISPPAKHIWAFYDQNMNFWNHYGELNLFTAKDQPTDISHPTLISYKGKIYPANRVHSAWVGFEEKDKPGLNQLFMKDFFMMWKAHREYPESKYKELSKITDDNKDGIIEVNRAEEIDALLKSVKDYLTDTKFPLEDKKLVWVSDSKAWYSSKESKSLPHEIYEATAYASVYKFSHDVVPAKAALGINGCTDCHSSKSNFFNGSVLDIAFEGEHGEPKWMPNYRIMDLSAFWTGAGIFREENLKPLIYVLMAYLLIITGIIMLRQWAYKNNLIKARYLYIISWAILAGFISAGILASIKPGLMSYMIVSRFQLDANHFWIGILILTISVILAIYGSSENLRNKKPLILISKILWIITGFTGMCGGLMLLSASGFDIFSKFSYSGFDIGLFGLLLISLIYLILLMALKIPEKGV